MNRIKADIAIIGGGAAGMMAAAALSYELFAKNGQNNVHIVIIEKEARVGRKLLKTGNGRCNLTNSGATAADYSGSFDIADFLDVNTPTELIAYFAKLGLICKSDAENRVYPISNSANSVLDVLRNNYLSYGVAEYCNNVVSSIDYQKQSYIIKTDSNIFEAATVILATGSCASVNFSKENIYSLPKALGHNISKINPGLSPIQANSKILSGLKGIRCNCKVQLKEQNNVLATEYGELQFAENGLSGICIFNLSNRIHNAENPKVEIDFLPNTTAQDFAKILCNRAAKFAALTIDELFFGILNKRIGMAILKTCKIGDFSRKLGALTKKETEKIANCTKAFSVDVSRPQSFAKAQIAIGGVIGSEISSKTMQSTLHGNLYVLGELIDCNGQCGGFNLNFAFSSAVVAAKSIAEKYN
ncbi:MAG: aminoacetone oxidase family FAD-binding enzyme [Oscillospiraceae bacterium]|nr:aminoacetone oxidase family FAD-binding enzyme [Oscillospiraceae bacterium]